MKTENMALFSVVILASAFSVAALNPFFNVNVSNLPVDEYGNLNVKIIDEGSMQIYKDAIAINIIGSDRVVNSSGLSQAIATYGENYPFAFSPKQSFINVTDAWIFIVYRFGEYNPPGDNIEFSALLNVEGVIDDSIKQVLSADTQMLRLDPSKTPELLKPGFNVITWNVDEWIYLYQFTILIEYEYQA